METRTGDWKGEKHVPVIEVESMDGGYSIAVTVGKEIAHPNTPEHHIGWIELYFKPEGTEFPVMIGRADFTAHGEMAAEPHAEFTLKTNKKGELIAISYCNIHGLWESRVAL